MLHLLRNNRNTAKIGVKHQSINQSITLETMSGTL